MKQKKHTKIVHKNVYIKDISPTCIRIYGEGDSAKLASEMLCRRLGLPVPGSRHGKGNKTDTGTSASSGVHSYQRQHSGSNSTDAIGSTLFEFASSTGTKVSIKYGDITKEMVDAIVNDANDKLQHNGGVAAAIVKAGGYSIQRDSDKITDKRTLNVGEVVCTKAGSLPCKAVLHVVGPYWKPYDADTVTAYLYDCCWNLLTKASNWDYKSVAIPAIGTGIYRVPKHVCAQMMFKAVKDFTDQQDYKDRLRSIIFIDIDWDTVKTFQDVFQRNSSVQRTDGKGLSHAMESSVDPSIMQMQVALPTTHPLSQPGMTQSATYAKVAAPQSASANKHHKSKTPKTKLKGEVLLVLVMMMMMMVTMMLMTISVPYALMR
ncbi:protein mono-ADP-ribosyltransferase PARP9-like [Ptychodera flava]|uniref:protein mono-ADP-ribosyltransferase PARP9-like n=1 Tax=Ptychodera flava TaxID=63121 RepID=UPI00396A3073